MPRNVEGITPRHSRGCPRRGSWQWRCGCTASYQAQVWSRSDGRRLSRSFPTLAAAKNWRQDAAVALREGTFTVGESITVREAAERWIAGARSGTITNRSGNRYKPSCLRGYIAALENRIVPALGQIRVAELRRRDVQRLVDQWLEAGVSPSCARNWLMPLRAICRRAISREDLAVNPTSGLELPAVRGRRERIATPGEVEALLDALPDDDRALWTTAFYAGLRRGELAALLLEDIDFDANLIHINASWDVVEGRIDVKSAAGRRRVPMPKALRSELLAHRLRLGRSHGLAFGRSADQAFRLEVPTRRAAHIWRNAGLTRISLHECRHTYASLMIAAGVSSGQGVNMKALSVFMGHASIQITYDRYGHLLPGAEQDAADMLDQLLDAKAS